jgi:hypothetical protein
LWDFERKWRNWLMDLRVGENPLLSRVCTEEEEEEEEGEKDMSSLCYFEFGKRCSVSLRILGSE